MSLEILIWRILINHNFERVGQIQMALFWIKSKWNLNDMVLICWLLAFLKGVQDNTKGSEASSGISCRNLAPHT